MNKTIAVGVLISTLVVSAGAYAAEGGDPYPNGIESWLSPALPPPGNYLLNYMYYYNASLVNGSGDSVPGSHVTAAVEAPRFVFVTDHKLFGGQYVYQVIFPIVHQNLELGGVSKSETSLANIIVDPFILGWHVGNWFLLVADDDYIPSSGYNNSGEPQLSIGTNYWTIEPIFDATYLSPSGWEFTGKFMYDINSTNSQFRPAVGAPKMYYRSGNTFHMDYLIGRHFGQWGFGVAGYYLNQVQDDTLNGESISDTLGPWSTGRRGRVFAAGPSIAYTTTSHVQIVGQWEPEMAVRNRFSGNPFILKIITHL